MATASLPMYDLPEVRNAHDTLWTVLAQNLRDQGVNNVPDCLTHGPESHSGMSALRHLVAQCHTGGKFFSSVKVSGSHIASLDRIRRGKANIAAIDSVTLALLSKHQSHTMEGLKILGATYTAPAPPYVVRVDLPEKEVTKITDALLETFNEPTLAGYRAQLLLTGLTRARQEDYWVLEAYKDHATKHGFPSLQ